MKNKIAKKGERLLELIYSGTTPEHLGEADCFMSKSEPVKAFLAMIDDLVNRHWG
jgi:hypothetical protein